METILTTLFTPFFDGSIFGPHPTERGLSIWMAVKVMGVILPTLFVVSWIWTVSALHRRGVYFWTLASTWVIPPVGSLACSSRRYL
jgi:peptidoglycan biosynthesis protein MviN/MurJ (putative lipid II flippase)